MLKLCLKLFITLGLQSCSNTTTSQKIHERNNQIFHQALHCGMRERGVRSYSS